MSRTASLCERRAEEGLGAETAICVRQPLVRFEPALRALGPSTGGIILQMQQDDSVKYVFLSKYPANIAGYFVYFGGISNNVDKIFWRIEFWPPHPP
ncbi:hypothetical protein [Paenibacillus aestuarii]|uniref:Uncharacterized protein n=1 Tax=Paenibacillus aestuarii TaxID=516965 RepID=A0ABW0KFB6_9BACL|nr:hypothetical protein [Paenibacillus aestuarii]